MAAGDITADDATNNFGLTVSADGVDPSTLRDADTIILGEVLSFRRPDSNRCGFCHRQRTFQRDGHRRNNPDRVEQWRGLRYRT